MLPLRHLVTRLPLVNNAAMVLPIASQTCVRMDSTKPGTGVGRGGGAGGSIREAGGKFGEIEAARENEYFRKLQREQLKNLRKQLDEEVDEHERQMRRHQEAIDRHKKRIQELSAEEKNAS